MYKHVTRNYPLITRDEQEKLANITIAIAGTGGIGAWAADALVRMGIGKLKIADLECYEIHNLNRQAYSNTENVGQEKVKVVADNLLKINPDLDLEVYDEGINSENIAKFLDGVEAVIDAVEYFEFDVRRMLQSEARRRKIPTFLNVVAGFNVALFVFNENSMSFDEYIGYEEKKNQEKNFFMPFERTIPVFPEYMIDYCEPGLANKIFNREMPITNLCAPIAIGAFLATMEMLFCVLHRKEMILAPKSLVIDLFNRKYIIADAIENPPVNSELE